MSEEIKKKDNFKDSFKATLLFSGVQVYQIIIRVIRSKFVAMLLGPAGMGITSLLRSTTDLISASTNLGLRTSGVKSIAAARAEGDTEKIERTIAVMRRLVLLTGVLGMSLCALLSPVWSRLSFGNSNYIWSFVGVSLLILFDQVYQGEFALMQGMQQRRLLARASVISQTISLALTIPLYYFFGVKAIVAVLVLGSLLSLCIGWFYVRKLKVKRVPVSFKDIVVIGKEMVKLGLLLSIQHLLSQGGVYLVRNFVSQTGGLEQVGLYSAGTTITTMYLGLVFTAMSTDYFPRLAVTKTMNELSEAVRSQAEIALLLFAPIIIAFVIFIKPVILLLYSDKFLPVEGMLYITMAATLIKAMAWSLSYTLLAKASAKIFFINEVICILYTYGFNILGYKYFGLTGFGISMFVSYVFYLIQMSIVTSRYFHLKLGNRLWRLFAILEVLVVIALSIKVFLSMTLGYILGSILLVGTCVYSFRNLDQKMGLRRMLLKKLNHHE